MRRNPENVEVEQQEVYTVAILIDDLNTIYQNISASIGIAATDEQRATADSLYNLVRYGSAGGLGLGGSDVPFIGTADNSEDLSAPRSPAPRSAGGGQ